jgi:hypothetical protein
MTPKKIYIDFGTPIEEWADTNKRVIMDSIYSNVFDFVESEENDRVVLQVSPKPQKVRRLTLTPSNVPVNVDFIISKDDIELTLRKMMEYYIEVEEYERCAEILKLQNGETKPKPKKRGRPKKITNK